MIWPPLIVKIWSRTSNGESKWNGRWRTRGEEMRRGDNL